MNRTIEIIIAPTGEIQIDAVGFKGPDCEKATKFLEEALGVVKQKTKKPEYHQRNTRISQQRIGRRITMKPRRQRDGRASVWAIIGHLVRKSPEWYF
jgi:hypothetical protein